MHFKKDFFIAEYILFVSWLICQLLCSYGQFLFPIGDKVEIYKDYSTQGTYIRW